MNNHMVFVCFTYVHKRSCYVVYVALVGLLLLMSIYYRFTFLKVVNLSFPSLYKQNNMCLPREVYYEESSVQELCMCV